MTKRWISIALSFFLMLYPFSYRVHADDLLDITHAAGYTDAKAINRPKASIVIDGETGAVLWEDNADTLRDPASMSKLMTLYLVFDALKAGQIQKTDVITATTTDQAMAGLYEISNNKIVAGVDYTIEELIIMTLIPSSNVATIMLANHLSNHDPDQFIDKMNTTAQDLGMLDSQWVNPSGAAITSLGGYYLPKRYDHNASNQISARDMAILGYQFLQNHPDITDYTKERQVTVKQGTSYEETFDSYNHSLPQAMYGIKGVNGLKTGSSPRSDFNYIATADRGGQKTVTVIMGVGSWADQDGEFYRHPFGNALTEKTYQDYRYQKVLSKGEHSIKGKTYRLETDFYATVRANQKPEFEVVNQQLRLVNGLASVRPQFEQQVAVQPVRRLLGLETAKLGQKSKNLAKRGVKKLILSYLAPILLATLGILGVALVAAIALRRKRHKNRRKRNHRLD